MYIVYSYGGQILWHTSDPLESSISTNPEQKGNMDIGEKGKYRNFCIRINFVKELWMREDK